MIESWHIIPANDLKPHTNNSDWCKCAPLVKILDNGNNLVVHNSYDGREFYEDVEAFEELRSESNV